MARRFDGSEQEAMPPDRPRFQVGETVKDLNLEEERWRIATTLYGMSLFISLYRLLSIPEGFPRSPHSYPQLTDEEFRQVFFTLNGVKTSFYDVEHEPAKHWPDNTGVVFEVDTRNGEAGIVYRRGDEILLVRDRAPVFALQLIKDWSLLIEAGNFIAELSAFTDWADLQKSRTELESRAGKTSIILDCTRYGKYPVLTRELSSLEKPLALNEERDFELAMRDWQLLVAKFADWLKEERLELAEARELSSIQEAIQLQKMIEDEPDLANVLAPHIFSVAANAWYAPAYHKSRS